MVAMDAGLQAAAAEIAQQLRQQGRSVDLVLESKRMKWVFRVSCFPHTFVLLQIEADTCSSGPSELLLQPGVLRAEHLSPVACAAARVCYLSSVVHCRLPAPQSACPCADCGCAVQQAERVNAGRLVMVAPDEWAQGLVRVKDLGARTEQDVPRDAL